MADDHWLLFVALGLVGGFLLFNKEGRRIVRAGGHGVKKRTYGVARSRYEAKMKGWEK
jgi:hypothetical protein